MRLALTAAVFAALALASGASSAPVDAIDKAIAKVRAAKVLEEGAIRVLDDTSDVKGFKDRLEKSKKNLADADAALKPIAETNFSASEARGKIGAARNGDILAQARVDDQETRKLARSIVKGAINLKEKALKALEDAKVEAAADCQGESRDGQVPGDDEFVIRCMNADIESVDVSTRPPARAPADVSARRRPPPIANFSDYFVVAEGNARTGSCVRRSASAIRCAFDPRVVPGEFVVFALNGLPAGTSVLLYFDLASGFDRVLVKTQ
jgi:hypothetical protein